MSKLQVHSKFITDGPAAYNGLTIAEYHLESGNDLEALADAKMGVFWINEFVPDGRVVLREFDRPETYDKAIALLVEMGEKMDKEYLS